MIPSVSFRKLQAWWNFKRAMWRWWQEYPWIFDPRWGAGEQRRKNIDIAEARHELKKPDCESFGISHRYVNDEEHCCRCYYKKSHIDASE